MQPYLFPYLGYVHLIHAVDTFVVLDDAAFSRGWINRNRLLLQGRPWRFTMPVQKASQRRRICDLERADDERWRRRFLTRLDHAYRSAAHFAETKALVRTALADSERNLARWLTAGLHRLSSVLQLQARFITASSTGVDSRLRGQDRILEICTRLSASVYVNLPGGRMLYDAEAFAARGVALRFLMPELVPYAQGDAPFVPGLSIIDALMFNGPAGVADGLVRYSLAG